MAAQDPQPGSSAQYEAADKMLKMCSVAQPRSAARKQCIAPGYPNCLCVSFPVSPSTRAVPQARSPWYFRLTSRLNVPYRSTRLVPHSSGTGGKEAAFSGSHLYNLPLKASM